jgi:diguanylate cyclase (GGDEF)-like protein
VILSAPDGSSRANNLTSATVAVGVLLTGLIGAVISRHWTYIDLAVCASALGLVVVVLAFKPVEDYRFTAKSIITMSAIAAVAFSATDLALSGTFRAAGGAGLAALSLSVLLAGAAASTERGRLVERIRWERDHDPLTGLMNRSGFSQRLSEPADGRSVLLVDLDRFHEVNHALGYVSGDVLLQRVAQRISDELGPDGVVARTGGDEFGILLRDGGSADAVSTAVALLDAVERPFHVGDLDLELTASVGVAVDAGGSSDAVQLQQQAGIALGAAKAAHTGWEVFSPGQGRQGPGPLALAGELRRAIEADELEVHFQPKAELITGRVRGVEALVRWRHPRHGLLGPQHFVPLAERAGLIRPLTFCVLARAVSEQVELGRLGYRVGVAVNLSLRSVVDVDLPDELAVTLAAGGADPSTLTLEVTESNVMADPARTVGILRRLADLGIRISVDDFGTGYSSLAYLKRLPASEVKLDRSYVGGMLRDRCDAAIVRASVELAHDLGLHVVAEGVEDERTWAALAALGADEAQGYVLSRPLPPGALRSWLLARGCRRERSA